MNISESKYLSLVDRVNGELVAVLRVDGGLTPEKTNDSIIEKVLKATLEHYCFEDHEFVLIDKFEAYSDFLSFVEVQAEEIKGDISTVSRCFLELRSIVVY